MKSKRFVTGILMITIVLMLSAWTSSSNQNSTDISLNKDNIHSGFADIPKGLKKAKNPTYKFGSQVVVKACHMKGMYGARATIVGAYDTTAYAVTYTPTTGGPIVKNHKWVIESELSDK